MRVERHCRVTPTASTIVSALTTSTAVARKTATTSASVPPVMARVFRTSHASQVLRRQIHKRRRRSLDVDGTQVLVAQSKLREKRVLPEKIQMEVFRRCHRLEDRTLQLAGSVANARELLGNEVDNGLRVEHLHVEQVTLERILDTQKIHGVGFELSELHVARHLDTGQLCRPVDLDRKLRIDNRCHLVVSLYPQTTE